MVWSAKDNKFTRGKKGMKRKTFSILFALVLVVSFSLVTQVIPTALASSGLLPEVEFQIGENSSAEWTTEREYAGTYSVLLRTLYPTPLSHYARVAMPYGDTLGSISSISYWEYYVKDWPESVTELWGVYVSIELDTGTYNYPGGTLIDPALDGVADHWLMGDPHLQDGWSTPSTWPQIWNDWVQRTFDDAYFWSPIDGNESETTHQFSSWKEGTTGVDTTISATSIVLKTKFAIGEGIAGEGWPQDHYKKVYFDDLEINGTTYELEPRVVNLDTTQGFNTIQDGINAANPGDTIIVSDGTYTEDLTVNIANLTLKSENGKGSTTIQLVDGVGIDIQGGANNFTLGGAEGQGFNILSSDGGASTTFNIQLANGPSGVTISHNTIDTTGDAYMGISVGAAGATDLTISNNEFIAESGDGSIWGPEVFDVTVSDNTFNGGSYAIQFSGVTSSSPSVISGNTITGSTGSGGIVISNGEGTAGLIIRHNNISECSNGIYLVEYCATCPPNDGGTPGDMTTVQIYGNIITNNTTGLKIGAGSHVKASNFLILFNHFIGNESVPTGLHNYNTEWLHAENNWWGDDSGPSPSGTGDSISGNVYYSPWLGAPLVLPGIHFEYLEAGYHVVDASAVADTVVKLTVSENDSETDIYIAKYQSQPFPPQVFHSAPLGKYIDIYFSNPGAVDWPIRVEMSYTDEEARGFYEYTLGLYYHEMDMSFNRCETTSVDTENNVVWADVTIEEAGYGVKRPFAPGGELIPPPEREPPAPGGPVGGEVYRVNKLAILVPWLSLALIIVIGGSILVMRRRRAH